MNFQFVFILSLVTIIHLSCEESILVKGVGVQLKDEFKPSTLTRNLRLVKELSDSNAQFALDLYHEIVARSETGNVNSVN